MKLSEVIKECCDKYYKEQTNFMVLIAYRTFVEVEGETFNVFAGAAVWDSETGVLAPLDGDSYSLEDEIKEYSVDDLELENGDTLKKYITVWY